MLRIYLSVLLHGGWEPSVGCASHSDASTLKLEVAFPTHLTPAEGPAHI